MRMLAAAAVLVSAGVHLYLWFHVFQHTHVVGPAFMVNAVGGAVIAILIHGLHSAPRVGPHPAHG